MESFTYNVFKDVEAVNIQQLKDVSQSDVLIKYVIYLFCLALIHHLAFTYNVFKDVEAVNIQQLKDVGANDVLTMC